MATCMYGSLFSHLCSCLSYQTRVYFICHKKLVVVISVSEHIFVHSSSNNCIQAVAYLFLSLYHSLELYE